MLRPLRHCITTMKCRRPRSISTGGVVLLGAIVEFRTLFSTKYSAEYLLLRLKSWGYSGQRGNRASSLSAHGLCIALVHTVCTYMYVLYRYSTAFTPSLSSKLTLWVIESTSHAKQKCGASTWTIRQRVMMATCFIR